MNPSRRERVAAVERSGTLARCGGEWGTLPPRTVCRASSIDADVLRISSQAGGWRHAGPRGGTRTPGDGERAGWYARSRP